MFIIDLSPIYSFLKALATTLDFKFAYSFFIAFVTVESFLSVSVKALREEPIEFSLVRYFSYLSVCLFSCALSVIEASEQAKTFPNVIVAIISSVILFQVTVCIYSILLVSIRRKVNKTKKSYLATVKETKEQMPFCQMNTPIKIYPLKTKKLKDFVRHDYQLNFKEVIKLLDNLEPLCFDDIDIAELTRLTDKATFLDGVMLTPKTAKDFNELFLDIVKLTSRLNGKSLQGECS